MIIPDWFFFCSVFILALMIFIVDFPCVLENWSLRKERNKFLDKIHNLKRENRELKRELLDLKKNTQNENTKVGEN